MTWISVKGPKIHLAMKTLFSIWALQETWAPQSPKEAVPVNSLLNEKRSVRFVFFGNENHLCPPKFAHSWQKHFLVFMKCHNFASWKWRCENEKNKPFFIEIMANFKDVGWTCTRKDIFETLDKFWCLLDEQFATNHPTPPQKHIDPLCLATCPPNVESVWSKHLFMRIRGAINAERNRKHSRNTSSMQVFPSTINFLNAVKQIRTRWRSAITLNYSCTPL